MTTDATIECASVYGRKVRFPKSSLLVRPSAYAVVIHAGKVLVVTNSLTGRFYFPGGGIEKGERLLEGLRREVKEETGIEVAVEMLLHFAEDFFYYDPYDQAYHALLFYYACKPKSLDLHSNNSGDDGEIDPTWVGIEDLTARDFHNHGEMLMEVLQTATRE